MTAFSGVMAARAEVERRRQEGAAEALGARPGERVHDATPERIAADPVLSGLIEYATVQT